MKILFLLLYVLMHSLDLHADISVINSVPENCSNESRIFTTKQKISIGPTWVLPCRNVCSENGQHTVWYSPTVCIDSTITAVRCTADDNGCYKVVADPSAATNFNCASNPGNGWKCVDRTVATECVWPSNVNGAEVLNLFSANTTRAVCQLDK